MHKKFAIRSGLEYCLTLVIQDPRIYFFSVINAFCICAIARFAFCFSFALSCLASWIMWRKCMSAFTFETASTEFAIELATIIARHVIAIAFFRIFFKFFARPLAFAPPAFNHWHSNLWFPQRAFSIDIHGNTRFLISTQDVCTHLHDIHIL